MLNNNYKNEAINIMEQIKKAEETRLAMIKEAQETLVILGAETNSTVVEMKNVININKGKIVELVKEVEKPVEKIIYVDKIVEKIIDNTDYTTIEELRNRNDELEIQLANALNKIAKLELAAKTVEPLATEEVIAEEVKEESKIIPAKFVKCDVHDYKYRPTREEILANIYYVYNVPEELRNHEMIEKMFEEYNEMFNKREAKELKYMTKTTREILNTISSFGSKFMVLKNKAGYKHYKIEERIAQEQKEEELRAEREASRAAFNNIKTTKEMNKQGEYVYKVQGTITINNEDYQFIFDNSHINPCLFGCFDKEIITEAKHQINYKYHITTDNKKYTSDIDDKNNKTILDKDNKIFAYQSESNEEFSIIKGYIEGYAFVWDTREELPCGTPIKNALNNNYRKMNASWGNGFVQRAQMIKDFCIDNFSIEMPTSNDEEIIFSKEELDDDLL